VPTTIYFAGAISGGRGDVTLYQRIVAALRSAGHHVLAGAVANETIGGGGEPLAAGAIFDRDLAWIADVASAGGVLVAEVSTPSTGVGYEIATARYRHGIRVICLYRTGPTTRCTAMVAGDQAIEMIEYSAGSIEEMIARLIRTLG
jgi:hypothetical protein